MTIPIIILNGAKRRIDTLPTLLKSISNTPVTILTYDSTLKSENNTVKLIDYGTLKDVKSKMACAYYQCLTGVESTNGVIIVEDDAVFIDGWYDKLVDIINSIKTEKYVLSLYDWGQKLSTPYFQNPIGKHCGAVGLYYPQNIKEEFTKYYSKYSKLETRCPHDMRMLLWLQLNNIPLYISNPSLAITIAGVRNSTWH